MLIWKHFVNLMIKQGGEGMCKVIAIANQKGGVNQSFWEVGKADNC